MNKVLPRLFMLVMIALLAIPAPVWTSAAAPSVDQLDPSAAINFTILHTNDFHGNLQLSGSNPGIARMAKVVKDVRTAVGANNVLLLDAGDEMQGSLMSNLWKGEPTIAAFNSLGYNAATFGNHEFDWGQTTLADRVTQATYPFLAANLVVSDTGNCNTAGWTLPAFVDGAYQVFTVGTAPNQVKVGVIGITSQETPYITIASATAGVCFKDAKASILHYYDQMKTDGAQVLVVLSHLGYTDGGYGYGFTVTGDQTLAKDLNTAGKPVDLIVGGHSHTDIDPTKVVKVGNTTVVQAHYAGRKVGRADMSFDPATKAVTVTWSKLVVDPKADEDATMKALIDTYANDPAYKSKIGKIFGYTKVPLIRNYDGESLMSDFVQDAVYNQLNSDADAANDVDMVFNNAGGIRADIGTITGTYPLTLTYGSLFNVLPFGNQTAVGTMTGVEIQDLLNQSATLFKGAIQPAGIKFKFYRYAKKLNPSDAAAVTWAWGAYDVQVYDKGASTWAPLDLAKTYKVATNEFLAPAGQDGYLPFKYMKAINYYGDMLDTVTTWVSKTYTTPATGYNGPLNDGKLDGRITRDGDDSAGSIVPITILHHNDSHGRLAPSGTTPGYTNLAAQVKIERQYNPDRTLLFSVGDNIQGDSMMYYYRTAPQGFDTNGATLPMTLTTHPLIAAFNAMNYDAMVLGNHEFNFGSTVFKSVMKQATFPVLQANISDTGAYGLADVGVKPYIQKEVGPEKIKLAILGIGNHRVPSYELPSNIQGLAFTNPITTAKNLVPALDTANDAVIALTHIGFTSNPKSTEVDSNVDTNLAAQVSGIDAIIGSHSHTDPTKGEGAYKYLPSLVVNPDHKPVLINQANRYNTFLGEVVLGMKANGSGGYDVVTRVGKDIAIATGTEDAAVKAIVTPYYNYFQAYNDQVVGQTATPIDALPAFTEETNGANLQADASLYELAQHGIDADFYLAGAMTNSKIAATATPSNPYTVQIKDLFTAMPYENSLVTLNMNGPQLKAVLERAYYNYYYYKYFENADPKYGGISHYTTCMLATSAGAQISYKDTAPALPDGNNVAALTFTKKDGTPVGVDFTDATKFYRVASVNYLVAGACNFSPGGVNLWPVNQVVSDTQYYVRDAVINYMKYKGVVAPTVEGRVVFPAFENASPLGAMLVFTATNNLNVTFAIPNGTFSGPVTVAYTKLPDFYSGSRNTAGVAFDLSVFMDGQPVKTLTRPITVYVEYTNADVAGMLENGLTLKYWNGTQWSDAACGAYDRHPDQNYFSVPICHLSTFGVFGQYPRYLPLLRK